MPAIKPDGQRLIKKSVDVSVKTERAITNLKAYDVTLGDLVAWAAPKLSAMKEVGTDQVTALLISELAWAWDHIPESVMSAGGNRQYHCPVCKGLDEHKAGCEYVAHRERVYSILGKGVLDEPN